MSELKRYTLFKQLLIINGFEAQTIKEPVKFTDKEALEILFVDRFLQQKLFLYEQKRKLFPFSNYQRDRKPNYDNIIQRMYALIIESMNSLLISYQRNLL